MELWVRSQDKNFLLECKNLRCFAKGDGWYIMQDNFILGKYNNRAYCLEILDEIQKLLIENSDPLVLLQSSIDDTDIQDGAIIECSPKDKAKVFQKSILVYEMPEK